MSIKAQVCTESCLTEIGQFMPSYAPGGPDALYVRRVIARVSIPLGPS